MNFFKDYIKDPLYHAAVKVLSDTSLFEEAYNRRHAMIDITPHADQVALKLVMVQHAPTDCTHLPHWKTSTSGHLGNIFKKTFLRGGRMKQDDIHTTVFEEPMGEYDDYLRRHAEVVASKKDIKFSPPTPEDYSAIKAKYAAAISHIISNTVHPPTYDGISGEV